MSMHSENKVTRHWYHITGKKVLFIVLLILTSLFCEWPDFHPEHYLGADYHWWLDMIFHGGYYLVITILLYIVFCKGKQTVLFWLAILLTSYAFEGLQEWVPGRTVSLLDFTSNSLGITLGTVITSMF